MYSLSLVFGLQKSQEREAVTVIEVPRKVGRKDHFFFSMRNEPSGFVLCPCSNILLSPVVWSLRLEVTGRVSGTCVSTKEIIHFLPRDIGRTQNKG